SHWLDLLMESDLDMVGPVTNANGNEQTIWIDYEVEKDFNAFTKVEEFAAFRASTYRGYEVSSENVTAFCSLMKRTMLESTGEFDPLFFPGGFEDADLCERFKAKGGRIGIRRDCYIHHWGGGSFSKLNMDNRMHISLSNMKRFESKWNTLWTGTQQLLPDSLFQDMQFLAQNAIEDARAWKLLQDTNKGIKALLKGYESARIEMDKRVYGANVSAQQLTAPASCTLEADKANEEEKRDFTVVPYFPDPTASQVGHSVLKTACGLAEHCVECVAVLYHGAKTSYHILRAPLRRKSAYQRALSFISESEKAGKGTVCILAPMYTKDNLADGYFQRVFAVDQHVLKDYAKLYIEHYPQTVSPFIEYKDSKHMVLYGDWCNPQNVNALKMLCTRSGRVYSHSLLRCVEDSLCPLFLHWLTQQHVKFIVDMHGAIPEEAAFYDNWEGAQTYQRMEEVLVAGADAMIAVNHAMVAHFQKKYDYTSSMPSLIVMPIYLDEPMDHDAIANKLARTDYAHPLAVYAGGLHKWQNISLMQDVIAQAGDRFCYDLLVREPDVFVQLYGKRKKPAAFKVRCLPPEQVFEVYRDCHYGFILRDDIVVNNVACPTKLIEYIRFGVLPIMKTEHIGDFAHYGMKYLSYEDFSNGKIPDAEHYQEMIEHNAKVLACFTSDYEQGRSQLLALLEQKGAKA
ncbi:MAG: hypothetical protein RR865_14105, partial [Clostridia bacterium]